MKTPTEFHLKKDDDVLAVLKYLGYGHEVFWYACDFTPTAAFDSMRAQFGMTEQGSASSISVPDYDHLRELGIALVDVANDARYDYFLIEIHGNRADVRFA